MRGYVSYLGIITSLFFSISFFLLLSFIVLMKGSWMTSFSVMFIPSPRIMTCRQSILFLGLSLNGACDQWICRWIGFLPRFSFSFAASIHLHSSLFLALIAVELIEKLGRAQSHGKCFLIPTYYFTEAEKAKGKLRPELLP